MGRRQRRDPLERRVGEVVGFVGLVIFACVFVPGVRAVFSGILVLLLIGIGIALVCLIGWAIYRHHRERQETDYAAVYLAGGGHAPPPPSTTTLSRELLDALEWRRFEQLVTWYFEKKGFEAKRSRVGADGGVDILLFNRGENSPFAYVQCKAWHQYKVGIKPVRELFGVMASDEIQIGYFVTTGEFTEEAARFARGKEMTLVDGSSLLAEINALPESDRSAILQRVTAGDYTTPTCPRCDVKMVRRTGGGGDFWGCPNYSRRPSCRQTFKLRER